eukprot:COSAG01_NODE_10097_length_2251_cov_4.927974_3_plen_41_part_00
MALTITALGNARCRSLHTRERSYDFEARSVRGVPCLPQSL